MFPATLRLLFDSISRPLSTLSSSTTIRMASSTAAADPHSIYQFTVKDAEGKDVSLDKYKGKVVLVVNVASECGFTKSNYSMLKEIMDKYKEKGLAVAAFPCNQFGGQEPGCELDVKKFQKEKYNFEPDLYAKIDVNGKNAAPLYDFLKKEQGGLLLDAIKWNFTTFLVDKNGHPIKRYGPTKEPEKMIPDIEKALAA